MALVFTYARWSSLEQSDGSTLARQAENCKLYADANGWTIAEAYIDKGRSAYTGANIKSGQLGKFADRVRSGEIRDATLLVEELDRLSRQPADVMLTWLSPLVRSGLTIIVTQTGQRIDRAMLDHDMGGLMMLLITAFGSHKESAKKSARVGNAWSEKREKAARGEDVVQAHRHPKWLRLNVSGKLEPHPERAAIVQRIFRERIAGSGKLLIAKRLNAERVDTWANTKRKPEFWSGTYVGRVLCNRAVLGEWQPFKRARGAEARVQAGEAITNYYPAIIDAETFARANDKRAENQRKHQGRGRSLSNLLGTRARCGTCGGQMSAHGSSRLLTHKNGKQSRHYFLYCNNAKVAKTCDNQRGWTYDRVEGPALDMLLNLAMDDQHFARKDEAAILEAQLYALRDEVESIGQRMARLLDLLEDGDEAMVARYRQRKAEQDDAKARMVEAEAKLLDARGRVPASAHIIRVREVRERLWSEDEDERFEARSAVKAALNELIDRMVFDPEDGAVKIAVAGEMAHFFITADGRTGKFDFAKDGVDYSYQEDAGRIGAYVRRRSGASLSR